MTKKQRKMLRKIIISTIIFFIACIFSFLLPHFPFKQWISLAIFLLAYFKAGGDIVQKALLNIKNGQVFDENFLMSIATIGAFFVGEYPEGVAVMLFYQVGELFQSYAVGKSRKSIASLMQIRPDSANLLKDGIITIVSPEEVAIDDIILVKAGEKIPLDGIILEGASSLDTKALTGEALPREVAIGDTAISGCINLRGTLTIKVTKPFGESTVSKILTMVEHVSSKKAKTENFISKFARVYTPIVVILAVILAFIPPILLKQSFSDWIYRALNFLVVSCPCALVISIPLGFFGGIGGCARQGILMKGSNYLEALAKTDTFVFDKTGTLTKGNFKVTNAISEQYSKEELLFFASMAEVYSSHPIALSIIEEYNLLCEDPEATQISDIEEFAGFGVRAIINKKEVLVGNERLLLEHHISIPNHIELPQINGTIVFIAVENKFAGILCIEDEIKEDTPLALKELKRNGIKKLVMLTGDKKTIGEALAKKLALDDVYAELLPADKVTHVEHLLEKQSKKHTLAYVGDGINDAPVLARADIGIAMGGLGSDAAIEAADIVIMTDEISRLPVAIRIAKQTLSIVQQNIVFAIGVKVLVLILSALGRSSMWWAVFADVGVCVIAILNSMRALNTIK